MEDNSVYAGHQHAIAIDFHGPHNCYPDPPTRLVIHAHFDPVEECVVFSFPISLYIACCQAEQDVVRQIERQVGDHFGYRLSGSSQSATDSQDPNWRERASEINHETGNGRWYCQSSIYEPIPPPCPNCKSARCCKKEWGQTQVRCNMCHHRFGEFPKYTDHLGRALPETRA